MLLGIKTKKELFLRHLFIGGLGLFLVYLFYLSYGAWGVKFALWPDWSVAHPFWRAWAHAAFIFLFLVLIIGPLAKLWPWFARFIPWRRELGIWFAILSAGHGYAILDRWALWDIQRFFGLEYIEALGGYAMFRPEVGIMNMMALIIFPMAVLLAVTSSDRAVNFLGISSWKWLHNSLVHVIFYTAVLRWVLYGFFFFQPTLPDLRIYPEVWFLYPALVMALVTVILQTAAFIKTVFLQRFAVEAQGGFQVLALIGIAILLISPVALVVGSVSLLDSRIITNPSSSATQSIPQNYARSFYMVIKDGNQNISLWAQNIESDLYFRQTVSVGDLAVQHQIYRNNEQALYEAKAGPDGVFTWSKTENVTPQNIGIANIISGPAVWAIIYGVGEHTIQMGNNTLPVSIYSVDEKITDDIFAIPTDANPAINTLQ